MPRFPDPSVQPTMSVPEGGQWLGLKREAAYKAAQRGDIPTLRIGRKLVVPTAALRRMLLIDDTPEVA